ncbi:hypothetical protein COV18_05770 [Candidatus Woesearchaeota archaeon CG10_big_fil_rev_8_21_14_0_10_37_12]|nr:MAG: hypothetical protein COV18_05770 [Candidatus Woesearchaeota archaeon CG10_big_fil_rev_8_21_14_0_10_37_12]
MGILQGLSRLPRILAVNEQSKPSSQVQPEQQVSQRPIVNDYHKAFVHGTSQANFEIMTKAVQYFIAKIAPEVERVKELYKILGKTEWEKITDEMMEQVLREDKDSAIKCLQMYKYI